MPKVVGAENSASIVGGRDLTTRCVAEGTAAGSRTLDWSQDSDRSAHLGRCAHQVQYIPLNSVRELQTDSGELFT